jgi:hypothetical protein
LDSSRDRWGRVLLQRREAQRARTEKRRERTLVESDYLLGVYDGHRLSGARRAWLALRPQTEPFPPDEAADAVTERRRQANSGVFSLCPDVFSLCPDE